MSTTQTEKSTFKNEGPVEVLPSRQIRVLAAWQAPARVFKRRGREFWSTALSIAFLLGIILFFVKEWFLIVVIISAVFVFYVLSTIPPEEIKHQLTNRGVRTADRSYGWEELSSFWVSQHYGQKVLYFATLAPVPGRLELLLGDQDEEEIKSLLQKYLPEQEAELSFLDRAASWLSKKIPLETS